MGNLVSERLTMLVEALSNGNEKKFAESIGVACGYKQLHHRKTTKQTRF